MLPLSDSVGIAATMSAFLAAAIYIWFWAIYDRSPPSPPVIAARQGSQDADEKQMNRLECHDHSLADPNPILNLDLHTAATRNYLYANKTVRHPYHQVRESSHHIVNHEVCTDRI